MSPYWELGHIGDPMMDLADDEYLRHQLRIARLARHLMRFDEIGDAALEANLDDIHFVLGRRPDGWEAGEQQLEQFVLADATEGRHDEDLLWLFRRQNLRAQIAQRPGRGRRWPATTPPRPSPAHGPPIGSRRPAEQ